MVDGDAANASHVGIQQRITPGRHGEALHCRQQRPSPIDSWWSTHADAGSGAVRPHDKASARRIQASHHRLQRIVILGNYYQTTEAALVQLTATLVGAARANVRCAFWSDALVYMVM